jgi:hypothetical protein
MSAVTHALHALRKFGFVVLLAGAASWALAKTPAERKVINFGDAAVSIAWVSSWQIDAAAPAGMPGSVQFHAPDRLQMLTLLTPVQGPANFASDDALKAVVEKSSAQFKDQAVEKEIELQRISSGEAHGYFVCVTDKAPKAGEYKYLCQGAVALRDLPISFTLLYNERGKPDADRVLSALKTIQTAAQI